VYNQVFRLWSNDQIKQPILFYGQRRMGKTSVLLHTEANLGSQYLPVFLDMQLLVPFTNHASFLYNLADATSKGLNKTGLSIPIPNLPDYKEEPSIAFRKFIEAAETAIPPDKWAVLMLDEFEKIEEKLDQNIFPKDLMSYFRNIMQHHPRFAVVMAGSHRLDEMRNDYWDPLMQIAKVIKIGFLNREAAYQLITNPWDDFPLNYKQEAVEIILKNTCGQPLLIQAICSRILDRINERLVRQGPQMSPVVSLEDAEDEIKNTLETSEYFPAVIKALPPTAQSVLKELTQIQTEPGQWVPITKLIRDLNVEEKTSALDTLKLRDMVEEKEGQIRFTVEMVRLWLRKS